VVPVIPALVMFDGIVSQLRIYMRDELRAMTRSMQRPDYRREVGTVKYPRLPGRVSYLLGLPTGRAPAQGRSPRPKRSDSERRLERNLGAVTASP
jgi:hypothetical protein